MRTYFPEISLILCSENVKLEIMILIIKKRNKETGREK